MCTLGIWAEDFHSPWGGRVYPKGTIVKQVRTVRLPTGKASALHVPNATALFRFVAARSLRGPCSHRRVRKREHSRQCVCAHEKRQGSVGQRVMIRLIHADSVERRTRCSGSSCC